MFDPDSDMRTKGDCICQEEAISGDTILTGGGRMKRVTMHRQSEHAAVEIPSAIEKVLYTRTLNNWGLAIVHVDARRLP